MVALEIIRKENITAIDLVEDEILSEQSRTRKLRSYDPIVRQVSKKVLTKD